MKITKSELKKMITESVREVLNSKSIREADVKNYCQINVSYEDCEDCAEMTHQDFLDDCKAHHVEYINDKEYSEGYEYLVSGRKSDIDALVKNMRKNGIGASYWKLTKDDLEDEWDIE